MNVNFLNNITIHMRSFSNRQRGYTKSEVKRKPVPVTHAIYPENYLNTPNPTYSIILVS